jgi:hypothetical protein
MPRKLRFTRSLAVLRLRRQLEQRSYPRIQMAFIVALTGAFGLLVSFLLLRAGMGSMALRYPLALAAAYLFFFLLLWLWMRTRADDYPDLLEVVDGMPIPGSGGATPPFRGGGGAFGGGGSSGSFVGSTSDLAMEYRLPALDEVPGVDVVETDEMAIPILAVLFALGLALASLYIVYLAPVFLAELLVDGVLSYGLYRHLRAADARHWLETAVRRTLVPFVLTAIFLTIAGAAMAIYAPGARSIGEVVRPLDARR